MVKRSLVHYTIGAYIAKVLEIRLPQDTWRKIVRVSHLKQTSYSWVVRYCLFRLIQHKNVFDFMAGKSLSQYHKKRKIRHFLLLNHNVSQQKNLRGMHRHKLCLYGDDAFYIRAIACKLDITMTHLVRLALAWNLNRLERAVTLSHSRQGSRFHRLSFYWLGIKVYNGVEFPTKNTAHTCVQLVRFREFEYW